MHLNAQLPHAGLPVAPGYTWLNIINTAHPTAYTHTHTHTHTHTGYTWLDIINAPHTIPPRCLHTDTHTQRHQKTTDLGLELLPPPSSHPDMGNMEEIHFQGKLAPILRPLPTCSWTILLWADTQGPRPRSKSCSQRLSPRRQRCRLSCSASNTSRPEMGCWGTQG